MEHENIEKTALNFIEEIIENDLQTGKYSREQIYTRFPPEPNGYLHIGHAKSICLNFGLGLKYGGKTNLRFDDTNPETEKTDYVEAIMRDVRWLGFEWEQPTRYASDYFGQLYEWALVLVRKGKAYVDFSTSEEMDRLKKLGQNSPYRDTKPEENERQLEAMRRGDYEEGQCVLRAKIDMQAANRQLRDPVMYRIKKTHHHRQGDAWCLYPMYDWTHGLSDYIEGITHSICTLEFEDHRPLYEWYLEQLDLPNALPRQIEFSRLNVNYTITSKRKLKELVEKGYVNGWDDPRMPTLSGMRRRGYPAAAIRNFVEQAGVTKHAQFIDFSRLEFCVREELNRTALRFMTVFDPVRLVIENYPEGQTETVDVENNPEDEQAGSRKVLFGRELYIEREDFMIDPPKKYFRLAPGQMVRLKGAYIVRCDSYRTDEQGRVSEIRCTYLPESRSGSDTSGIKVKGTLHWVSATHALPVELRLYDRLFNHPAPDAQKDSEGNPIDYKTFINPNSLQIAQGYGEAALKNADTNQTFQFIRKGYFRRDEASSEQNLIFNRIVTLKDGWTGE